MARLGVFLTVPDDQAGKNPQLVTIDAPLPVNVTNEQIAVSSELSEITAAKNGFLYSFSGEHSIADGQYLAMNMTPVAPSIIHSIKSNTGAPVYVYNDESTGSADGILNAINMGFCSVDESPATAQLFYNASPVGDLANRGETELKPLVVVDNTCKPSFLAKNTTGSTLTIFITVIFEEIGARISSIGLTPSTLLEPTTEMSDYG